MILINNLLLFFAFMIFSSHEAIEEVNNPPKVSEMIELSLDDETRLQASDLPR
ncbi:MAG: hypothetical protein K1000chlam3_00844 [Chlamydiae bacterium]|nr:hypothetical protein [Chlamydiota bacterium]